MRHGLRQGSVLVALLGGVLLLGALLFAATFVTTLEGMAARSAARAAVEDAALQGALSLAASELAISEWPPPAGLGPWPHLGVPAQVAVSVVAPGTVRLSARLGQGNLLRSTHLVLQIEPEFVVRWRP